MEALLLRDAVYVNDRYQELQDQRRHAHYETVEKEAKATAVDADDVNSSLERSNEHFEHWQIVNRAMALDKQEPTSTLRKKFSVLDNILESLYAENEDIPFVTSPSKAAANRLDKSDGNSPVPFKELPLPTQIALKMFFRACQSLRDPTRLAVNCRLSVQIASRLPAILTTMPSCVLSPGLVDDSTPDSNGENIWSVFHQLFGLFEELLGSPDKDIAKSEQVCLPAGDRATIVTAYVALSLKWGRLGYLLKAVEFLLESCNEISGQHLGMLGPLFRELALVTVDLPQTAFDEEDKSCGYLMSFVGGQVFLLFLVTAITIADLSPL
ncbi:hypothetical protein PHYBOEH_005083 [Phytophthora boehmeriae]|uniref:Uncharacterized protein n=1 Tax=Phytophthora boehmeriae TaxID=109152 RepID=A0A8T1WPQ4_9STRA|nr:hypothetical protein PHYBOEH_005083 [Phytophthora boehmeriae]